LKVHTSLNLRYYVLFIVRVDILKLLFKRHKKMVREGSKSNPNQGVRIRTRLSKISNKVKMNINGKDIV